MARFAIQYDQTVVNEVWTMKYKGTVKGGVVVLDRGASLAEGTEVRVEPIEQPIDTLGGRLLKYAGKIKDLPSDMAENHDHYIHDRPRK